MTTRLALRPFLALVVLGALPLPLTVARAQSGAGPAPSLRQPPRDRVPVAGSGAIAGRVVDGVSGRPLVRARVALTGGGSPKGPVLTDPDGGFSFDALPPGDYTIVVERTGYLAARHPDLRPSLKGGPRILTVAHDQRVEGITIPMFVGGALAGRVTDSYGDPIENANVTALALLRSGRTEPRMGGMTNDLGEFRLARLPPGRYVLQVKPQTSYHTTGHNEELPLPSPLPTFYPGTRNLDQATVMPLARGETIGGLEVPMFEGRPSIVTGVVVASNGQPISGGNVNARLVSAPEMSSAYEGGSGISPDGSFRLQLPPGEYTLVARAHVRAAPPASGSDEQHGVLRLSLPGGTVESIGLLVGAGATASGRVVFEGTAQPPPPPVNPRVPLGGDEPLCRVGAASVAPDWSFDVKGLIGTCGVTFTPLYGRWMVKSVRVRGEEVLTTGFTFESGQHYANTIVVLTDRVPQMRLHVSDEDGRLTDDYVALAYPVDRARWGRLERTVRVYVPNRAPGPVTVSAQISPSMRELLAMPFRGLLTGEYHIVAVDDIDVEDAYDPDVLEQLAAQGARVLVGEDAPLEIQLRRIPFAKRGRR